MWRNLLKCKDILWFAEVFAGNTFGDFVDTLMDMKKNKYLPFPKSNIAVCLECFCRKYEYLVFLKYKLCQPFWHLVYTIQPVS